MAVMAIFGNARPPRPPVVRPPGRIVVIAWALAIVAVAAAGFSDMTGRASYGARALVTTGAAAAHVPAAVHPEAALIDPAQFRKLAPPVDGRPRVAIVVRGLGLSERATKSAIADLPADVTLALSAYGRDVQRDADMARAAGHEVFLDLPVEPPGYPANDAGPQALLSSLSAEENKARLEWSLARFIGFPGIVIAPGSPAFEAAATLTPLLDAPGLEGMVWAHFGARGFDNAKAAVAAAAVSIAAGAAPQDADAALERVEAVARKSGAALVIVTPAPATLARLKIWLEGAEARGIVIVPASALAVTPGA